jgi:Cys-tRNA synthase (O-phospho-L-seryl-tRNA:Cys-tRNA synthase)
MWYIAGEEAVLPEDVIPEEHDDEFRLPASKYNEVLQIVANEYGTNPGRDEIPVN